MFIGFSLFTTFSHCFYVASGSCAVLPFVFGGRGFRQSRSAGRRWCQVDIENVDSEFAKRLGLSKPGCFYAEQLIKTPTLD